MLSSANNQEAFHLVDVSIVYVLVLLLSNLILNSLMRMRVGFCPQYVLQELATSS